MTPRLCEAWLQNHRQLRMLVRRMEALSLRKTDRLLRALAGPHDTVEDELQRLQDEAATYSVWA